MDCFYKANYNYQKLTEIYKYVIIDNNSERMPFRMNLKKCVFSFYELFFQMSLQTWQYTNVLNINVVKCVCKPSSKGIAYLVTK